MSDGTVFVVLEAQRGRDHNNLKTPPSPSNRSELSISFQELQRFDCPPYSGSLTKMHAAFVMNVS